jgi:hypothetical protein
LEQCVGNTVVGTRVSTQRRKQSVLNFAGRYVENDTE